MKNYLLIEEHRLARLTEGTGLEKIEAIERHEFISIWYIYIYIYTERSAITMARYAMLSTKVNIQKRNSRDINAFWQKPSSRLWTSAIVTDQAAPSF